MRCWLFSVLRDLNSPASCFPMFTLCSRKTLKSRRRLRMGVQVCISAWHWKLFFKDTCCFGVRLNIITSAFVLHLPCTYKEKVTRYNKMHSSVAFYSKTYFYNINYFFIQKFFYCREFQSFLTIIFFMCANFQPWCEVKKSPKAF